MRQSAPIAYSTLKRGDIVNALGQIGVIVDALHSAETGNVCLYVSFVHNIGNSRQYDVLEITPERAKMLGIDRWTMATKDELTAAIDRRRQALEKALQAVLDTAQL